MKTKNTQTKSAKGFSADELAAMKETTKERKMGKEDWTGALLAKIAEMPEPDRSMARRLHAIITAAAPSLTPLKHRLLLAYPPNFSQSSRNIAYCRVSRTLPSRYVCCLNRPSCFMPLFSITRHDPIFRSSQTVFMRLSCNSSNPNLSIRFKTSVMMPWFQYGRPIQ